MKGIIYNIQRYSIHDGGGIRTVIFFKGCPLRCPWCCNPESQNMSLELVKIDKKCIKCKHCENDSDLCPSGALMEYGNYYSIEEVINEIKKDRVFYDASGGGVTLSGGEVLMQAEFARELLKRVKYMGIHTAVETCGQGDKNQLINLADFTDLFLYDLKIMNLEKAKKVLLADNKVIISNLRMLKNANKSIIARIPLIPGFTMDQANIIAISELLKEMKIENINLLPFHQYGKEKYKYLNKVYELEELMPPRENEVDEIEKYFKEKGFHVNIGGI